MHKWRLRSVMAEHKITNADLSEAIEKHPTTVARMKARDTMPSMDGDELATLCRALTKLARRRNPTATIGPWDLYVYTPDDC